MNNQNQPGTQGYIQPTVNAQGSPSRTMSAQYSQEAGFFGALDSKTAREQGKKLAREALAGFESVLKDANVLDDMLQKKIKSMDVFKAETKLTGEALKEHNAHYKELTKSQEKISKIQSSINQEMKKASPDEKKILDLEIKRVEAQAQAEKLITKTAIQKRIEVQMMEKDNALKEKGAEYEEKVEKANRKIYSLKQDINDIEVSSNDQYETYLEKLEKSKKLLEDSQKTLKETMSNFKDSVNSIFGAIDNIVDAIDPSKRIERWTLELDKFTKDTYQLANAWGTDYGQGFQSFKNSLMSEINSDNAFNPTQLNNAMKDLTQITFESKEAMMGMARDFTFAKEYMGMQNETLTEMYGMQLRTNDNTYFKKTMETIIGLQKSGISVSEEQLNQTIKSSMSLTDALIANGMSYEDVANFQSSLTEMMTTADATMGQGAGENLKNMMESIIKGGINGMAELGPTALSGYMSVLKGNGDANSLLNSFMNSEAGNVYGNIYKGGPSWGTTLIGSGEVQFGGLNAGLYRDYQNNFGDYSKVTEDLNKTTKDQIKMEERITEILDRLPDAYKTANGMAEAQLAADWQIISEQEENRQFWEASKKEILTVLSGIIAAITTVHAIAVHLNTAALNANTAMLAKDKVTSFLGGTGGKGGLGTKLFGAGSTLGGTAGVSKFSYGNGVLGTASKVAGVGGLIWTGADAISGGFKGLQDSEGNTVAEAGFGAGLSSAVSGTKVYDSTAGNVGMGALNGAAKGALIGSFFGPVGTGVGAAIGGISGMVAGIWKDNKRKEAKEEADRKKEITLQEEMKNSMVSNNNTLESLRNAALQYRYADYSRGPAVSGMGSAPAPSIVKTPEKVSNIASGKYGVGGTYRGVDIDGWVNTSDFGNQEDFRASSHKGIDFAGKPFGTAIGSAVNGKVTRVVDGYTWRDSHYDPNKKTYTKTNANYVDVLDPLTEVTYRYYHLSGAAVQEGQEVKQGNVIGYIGNTGFVMPVPSESNPTAGTHLHFAALKGGSYIDPRPYVTSSIFYPGALADNSVTTDSNEDADAISMKSRASIAVMPGATPGIMVGTGADNNESTRQGKIQEFRSSSIEGKLDMLNKTLLGMQAKQDRQDEILKALTTTPIYDYGV